MSQRKGPAISVKEVSKKFRIPLDKSSGIKQHIVNFYKRKKGYREFQALSNVTFDIKQGEFFGIVGRNGSGKSTLLKILAGVYTPDVGNVSVRGSLTPFIELGVGFNPELSGRENVFLNGALLGFSRKEMEAMYEDIVDFAELHEFMGERLKNYSSGMQVRLAFSIAIRARSDILLLDEVLAVGDEAFQRKCMDYFITLKKQNKTVVLVTHDMANVEKFCDRVLILRGGEPMTITGPQEAKKIYESLNRQSDNKSTQDGERWGTGEVTFDEVELKGPEQGIVQVGDSLTLCFSFKAGDESALKSIKNLVVGIAIEDDFGVNLTGPNTEGITVTVDDKLTYNIDKVPFNKGRYFGRVALFDEYSQHEYDHIEKAFVFDVVDAPGRHTHGKVDLFGTWEIK